MDRMFDGLFQPSHLFLIFALFFPVYLVPLWRILAKAGYPGWISLFAIIPFGVVAIAFWLAFTDWPVNKRNGFPFTAKYCPACGNQHPESPRN